MEMKFKLSEVLNLNQTLKAIIDDADTKVDALLKFKLLGIMKAIEPHAVNFEAVRNEKIMEYGEKTEDGNVQILKENKEAFEHFNNDLMDLINSDVAISIERLKADEVFNKGLKADYLVGLYSIIEE